MARSGVVLAGGLGSRMGAWKPGVPWRGRPLVAWAADALRPLVDEILVAHGPAADADRLARILPDARLVADPREGPLGGLVAAAREARGDVLLVAPCDAPFLAPPVYERLLAELDAHEGALYVAHGHEQPLVAAYRRDPFLAAARGVRSVKEAAGRLRLARLLADVHAAAALRDLDAPEDLANDPA